jgi:hypothetical protein
MRFQAAKKFFPPRVYGKSKTTFARKREKSADYEAFFGAQKDDIGLENTYRWDPSTE